MVSKSKRPSDQSEVSVVILDPPWAWSGGKSKSPKYRTMKLRDLCALAPTVKTLGGAHSLALMWVTIPTLESGMALLATYGYEYKSALIWKKSRPGTGFYSRCDAEIVLIGRRGSPGVPLPSNRTRTIFEGQPTEKRHSSKPTSLHAWVEANYPEARKVELFARVVRQGWQCIGDELGLMITPHGVVSIEAHACAPQDKAGAGTRLEGGELVPT